MSSPPDERAPPLRRVLDELIAFVGVATLDGTLIEANRAPLAATGLTREEVVGKKLWDCAWWSSSPETRERLREAVARAARGESVRLDLPVPAPDGDTTWIDFKLAPLRDAGGAVTHLVPSAVDVTRRRASEAMLRESEDRFRTLANNIDQLAWMADPEGWIFWYNRRWYDYTGTTLEEMQGWGWKKVHHPDHVDRVVARIQRSWDTGESWEDLFPLRAKDGEYRWFLSRAQPIRDEGGRIVRWFGTNTDVTEHLAAQEELRAKTRELEAEDERKELFIATLGHEIRNPLAALDGAVQAVAQGAAEPADVHDTIATQVAQLVTLADQLLEVSRVRRGKVALRKEPVDLARIVHTAAQLARPALDEKRQELELHVPDELIVDGDPTRLEQVLSNLLSNASKYTPDGGRIAVTVGPRDGQAVVEVADSGCGLAPDQLDSIFEPFVQASPGVGGLGIGLALVRGLVELHGGRVTAASAGHGEGSRFTVRLPLAARGAVQRAPRGAARPAGLDGLRVLVVDDLKDAANMLALLMRRTGAEVRCAYTAAEALEVASSWPVDAALVDLGLPDLPGYEVARALRAGRTERQLLLLAVTGFGDPQAGARALAAGFDERLVKPVDHERLHELLAEHHARIAPGG